MLRLDQPSRAPIPFEADFGTEAAARFPDAPAAFRDLVAGTAGCSPYLRGLLVREGDWLAAHLGADPGALVAGLLDDLPEGGRAEALRAPLREAKGRAALVIALADLGGIWEQGQVTAALTDFASACVDATLRALVADDIARGKLPGCTADDIPEAAGMFALAMGKMGAHELNYSSDIDLIMLFDETRHDRSDFEEVRARFIRATRAMCAILSDMTGEGYVFRTDLRLRPDPSVTPVCISTEAAERYYESFGRTWERAAFIKARPCAGAIAAGERFLRELRPFIWRRHLDYAAIQDAQDMRLRIRDHKGLHGPLILEGHDMKLGQGGIREIEFFTQTRQMIAGGRDESLRLRGTLEGLSALTRAGWIEDGVRDALSQAYAAHRQTEHRLQMIADAQTHSLPASAEGFARLAAFEGWGDMEAYRRSLRERLDEVAELTAALFIEARRTVTAEEAGPVPEMDEATAAMVERWRSLPALRSERAGALFRQLLPHILARAGRAADPAEALRAFDGFLSGLPAGVQLFSLFAANPQLIDLLVDICATAPGLARYLSRHSAVFDAVIGGEFFSELPDVEAMQADLVRAMAMEEDYERQLDTARRWMRDRHFRIGVHLLRGLIDGMQAGQAYSDLAQAVLRALMPVVVGQFALRHGPPPGEGAAVLAMGSLGARVMTAASDLDLIVIYDAGGAATSEGPRPLATTAYFARLTQALITALRSPTAEGILYDVDMRLRPSGRQGPVATALTSFETYQTSEAWTWEHLALTRARVVAGAPALAARIEEVRCAVLGAPHDSARVLADVGEMRARLAAAADPARLANPWEAKQGPGRMLDIEMVAQAGALLDGGEARGVAEKLDAGARAGLLVPAQAETLARAHARLTRLLQVARLVGAETFSPDTAGAGARELLLRETGCADIAELGQELARAREVSAALIDGVLAAPGSPVPA